MNTSKFKNGKNRIISNSNNKPEKFISKIVEPIKKKIIHKVESKSNISTNNEEFLSSQIEWWKNIKHPNSHINYLGNDEDKWYNCHIYNSINEEDNNSSSVKRYTPIQLKSITESVEKYFNEDNAAYIYKKKDKSGDEKWLIDVIKSGTLTDKIAALALLCGESPIHQMSSLDALIAMASKKEHRTAQLALDALKDLLLHNLLPDRRLIPFKNRILNHPNMNMQIAVLYYYEDLLIKRMEKIVDALDEGMKSNTEHLKKVSMEIASELLSGKPEQEARLLYLLVNKLGDPKGNICSKSIEQLRKVVKYHPAMKSIVVREVRQLIHRPAVSMRTIYSGVIFLSQIPIYKGDYEVSAQLVEGFVSLFEKSVKEDELKSRLLSALLTGINRAFPFLKNTDPLRQHLDALFRIVHNSSFATSTQALMLISHIALGKTEGKLTNKQIRHAKRDKIDITKQLEEQDNDNNTIVNNENKADTDLKTRFYRALYAKLLSDEVSTRGRNTLFLNLLYRSIKGDPSELRRMAFLKRLAMCALQSSPPIAAGLLFLISEVNKHQPAVSTMISEVEELSNEIKESEDTDDEEDSPLVHVLGNYDGSKREPSFASSKKPAMWEASLLRLHFHPSVKAFTNSFLEEPHQIVYGGDPITEFSLTAFLNRFAYKNPKINPNTKVRRPQPKAEEPVNTGEFINKDSLDIAPEKQFFHKFFGERAKLRVEGKSRDKSKTSKRKNFDAAVEGDGDGSSDEDEDAYEKEIDKFADKLAEDMMRDYAKNQGPDMDDFSEDEDDDDEEIYNGADMEFSDNSDFGSDDDNDDDSDDEEDVSASASLDFADFKNEKKLNNKKSKKVVDSDSDSDGEVYTGLQAYGDSGSEDEDGIYKNEEFSEDDDEDMIEFDEKPSVSKKRKEISNKNDNKTSLKNNKKEKEIEIKPVKTKKAKRSKSSDFAPAEDYQGEMESIMQEIAAFSAANNTTKQRF
jgi:ribosome biogenesis protein MAK21